MARDQRRLAAIAQADVAGYSRLMSRDESETLAALKTHRHEVIDPRIDEYGGRIVKTMGDGLLVEFGSAVDAVRCFVDVQRAMAERNAGAATDARIDFRVGINVGDIIIDGDDIFGNGVNVAARLEALAEPGGICISGKVYSEVADKLDCHFEDRGLQRVKNIALPIQVYATGFLRPDTAHQPDVGNVAMPAAGSRLFGRAEDLAVLRPLIEQHPLVTIIGPGGIGKTRLALAIAHELRDAFSERVAVELAPLSDPAHVIITVARALGLAVADSRTALDLVVQSLAGQRLLLLLDNCEHLLDAVDEVVSTLRKRAPDVHILATSQELLRQPDEHVYRLGTLRVPSEATLAVARGSGAVQLFAERARAVEPRFELGDANIASVVDICRRLDGIPLAIELAAARVPLLGVDGVRQRLDERFRLLTAGSRLALRRHQTLRAALEWSYGLLSPAEQTVFDRLGVFAGTFSLESAQKLAADDAIDEWDVLDHLGALVNKSMIGVDAAGSRYSLLETTRAFAVERLATRGITHETMRHHAEVTLALFEGFQRKIREGVPSVKVLDAIAPDLDNLRGALRWASDEQGDRRLAIALFGAGVASHGYFFYATLQAGEWIGVLRPRVDASIPRPEAARFWLACAEWGITRMSAEAEEDARRAVALYRDLNDRIGACRATSVLAFVLSYWRPEDASATLDEALRLRDPTWPIWLRALVDNLASLVLGNGGELARAREHALAFLAAAREVSVDVDVSTAMAILCDIEVASGNERAAVKLASELLECHPAVRGSMEDGRTLRIAATALTLVGRLDEAEAAYREAAQRAQWRYGHANFVLTDVPLLMERRGRLDDAVRVLAHVEAAYRGQAPRLVAQQIRDRLRAELAGKISAEKMSRLDDEGRRLTDDEACALAFASSGDGLASEGGRRE
jgi:predicted ATPase/class 3 adenylate cyclase